MQCSLDFTLKSVHHVLGEIWNGSRSQSVVLSSTTDPTRITQGPVDMEIIVGESIVLPCQVASDPVLDVSFSWAFNGQLIAKDDGHFELVGGVSDPQSYIYLLNVQMDSWHLLAASSLALI